MTVAIGVKVYDGIVLATDSATTLGLVNGGAQVYNNANKIFHLHHEKPIGAMTWGLGCIASASIATIAKDFRSRLMGEDPSFVHWRLDDTYTVEQVANRLVEMVFDELYVPEFTGAPQPMVLGFLIAGYSGGQRDAEAWLVVIEKASDRPKPIQAVRGDQSGWLAYAQPEAVSRLLNGSDPALLQKVLAVSDPAQHPAIEQVFQGEARSAVVPPMPLADAIHLARFLVDTTIGYSRFLLGPDTVGGPVELAAISRHEGFKWVSRKHYYSAEFNPRGRA